MPAASPNPWRSIGQLPPRSDEDDTWNVIIETPKGSRNKFKFDDALNVFKLSGVLPAGAAFPYDFGFLPSTKAEDGDPIDVLCLMDEPAYPGCLTPARLVGVIEAEQTETDGQTVRNDRLMAVAAAAHTYGDLRSIHDLNATLLHELEHFFVSYNEARGKVFKLLGCRGPQRARALADEAIARYREQPAREKG